MITPSRSMVNINWEGSFTRNPRSFPLDYDGPGADSIRVLITPALAPGEFRPRPPAIMNRMQNQFFNNRTHSGMRTIA